MSAPDRPVLRYFGGKWMLAPWIISHFPPHRTYVEPFGGAGSVLMRKPRSYAEVYNDLDSEVVNLFRVLRERGPDLRALLKLTPFARVEFDMSYEASPDPVERARRTIIRSFMGFGSNSVNREAKTGFRANANRSGTTPAHDWVNYPDCIEVFTERLSGVVIENRDAIEVMAQQDSPDALHFVDPPYVHDTRSEKHRYACEMTDGDHERLLSFLPTLKGAVILCGYEHPLYERLGWHTTTREAHADGARDRIEVLWLNPAAEAAQPQPTLFQEDK
jgi:DNA adenine methylase